MKKKISVVILSILIVISLFPTSIFADASSISVNSEAGLREAIAGSYSDILLTEDITITSEIGIARDVNINGQGFTIQVPSPGVLDSGVVNESPSGFRVFHINSGNVHISNIQIKGGNVNGGGSGVLIESEAKVKLDMVTITNSGGDGYKTSYAGGGIYNNGTCYINNSVINRNAATFGGGFLNKGTMVIENSSFSENRSLDSSGGGGAGENGGTLYVNNCTFANNKSTELGGAINDYQGHAYIMNSTFTGNVAYSDSYDGGAIRGKVSVAVNCVFAYNYKVTSNTSRLSDYSNNSSYAASMGTEFSKYRMINCIYHDGTNNLVVEKGYRNKQYTGSMDGSDDFLFSGGDTAMVLKADGTPVTEDISIYQPYIYKPVGKNTTVVPLRNPLPGIAQGRVRTIFDLSNLDDPIFAYYYDGEDTNAPGIEEGWYKQSGTSSFTWVAFDETDYRDSETLEDQNGDTRGDVLGSSSTPEDNLYMVKLISDTATAHGVVHGVTIYGDTYKYGTNVTIITNPDLNYGFYQWKKTNSSAVDVDNDAVLSGDNPYILQVTENVNLYPTYYAGDRIDTRLLANISPESIDLNKPVEQCKINVTATLKDIDSNSLADKEIHFYATNSDNQISYRETQRTAPDGTVTFTPWTPDKGGEYVIHISYTGDDEYERATVEKNLSVTSQTYNINYNLGDATLVGAPIVASYGTAFSVPAPTKEGKTFTGWKLTEGGDFSIARYGPNDNTAYSITGEDALCSNGASGSVYFKDLTDVKNGEVTLTPCWTDETYSTTITIKYDDLNKKGLSVGLGTDRITYSLTGSNGVYTRSGVPNGTYYIWVNGVNSGKTITVNDADASETLYYYTVSLNSNNGASSTTSTLTVLENSLIARPTTPVYAGHVLENWHKGSVDGDVWDFDINLVTGATSLYARWIESEANIITFKIGNTNGVITHPSGTSTTGSITVNLPAGTPLSGRIATFTNSPGSTVKIGEITQTSGITVNNFERGTTNYIVDTGANSKSYDVKVTAPLAQPSNLSWNGKIATWTAVPNVLNYEVELYMGGTEEINKITSATSDETSIDFSTELEYAGNYYFKVKAISDGTTNYTSSAVSTSAGKTMVGFKAPTNLKLVNKVASWNSVANADTYTVELYKVNASGDNLLISSSSSTTSYAFSSHMSDLGKYYFKVKTDASASYLPSRFATSEKVHLTASLSKPTNLDWDDETATWDSVDNAEKYSVKLYKKTSSSSSTYTEIASPSGITATNYDFSSQVSGAGEYYFTVQAIPASDGDYTPSNVLTSNYKTVNETLATPTGLNWSNKTATWNDVDNAGKYTVELYKRNTYNGDTYTQVASASAINATSYAFTYLDNHPGYYYFKVKAEAHDYYNESGTKRSSGEKLFSFTLATPTGLSLTGDTATWSGVANAENYTVELYRGSTLVASESAISATSHAFDVINTVAGNYFFKVKANTTANNYYTESNMAQSSNSTVNIQLATPTGLAWNGKIATWSSVDNAVDYSFELYKKVSGGADTLVTSASAVTSTSINLTTEMVSSGTYYFTVKANDNTSASGGSYLASDRATSNDKTVRFSGGSIDRPVLEPTVNLGTSDGNDGGGSVDYDVTKETLIITPDEGYVIEEIIIDGQRVAVTDVLTNVTGQQIIEIKFIKSSTAKIIRGVESMKLTITATCSLKNWNGIKWKKSNDYKLDYYQIWKSSNGNPAKLFYNTKTKKNQYFNNKKITRGVTYSYLIRGVRVIDGKKYYTKYSNTVKIKTSGKSKVKKLPKSITWKKVK